MSVTGLTVSRSSAALSAVSVLVFAFLYLPVVTMVVLSFNDSISVSLPWVRFTTRWYTAALENTDAYIGFSNSIKLALVVGLLSSLIGMFAAMAFRRQFAGKQLVFALLILPLVIPGVVMAVGLAISWNLAGLSPGLWTSTLVAHLVFAVPFAFIAIYPRVYRFDRSLEAAAMDLGATPLVVFLTIVLPDIVPGVIAGFLFSFTLSFDEFLRTYFVIGSSSTLPVYLWSIILNNPSPQTSAIATLSATVSLAAALLGILSLRWSSRTTTV